MQAADVLQERPLSMPTRIRGLVVVDGPIGAGKSTFIEALAKTLRKRYGASVRVVDEYIPVNLDTYYKDPANNAERFQNDFIDHLIDIWTEVSCQLQTRVYDFIICDRYWGSTIGFCQYMYSKGYLTQGQFDKMMKKLTLFIFYCPLFPEYLLYLDVPGERCYNQILHRGREAEKDASKERLMETNEFVNTFNRFMPVPMTDLGWMPGITGPDRLPSPDIIREAMASVRVLYIRPPSIKEGEEVTTMCTILPHNSPVDMAQLLIAAALPVAYERERAVQRAKHLVQNL